ncbi:MAG: hypothetical protein NTX92_04790, partial [Euryarchaeota archaeon]|nr:hypothetical protein [Euryarchaeota archaeon]
DLYDIWYLSKKTNLDLVLFQKKCEFKHLMIDINDVISRKTKFENAWNNSLKYQLKDLPDIKIVFADVIAFLMTNTTKN